MEGGGFEAQRGTPEPAPGFQPPVEPGTGPSIQALSLVARIMRGRELAADAAGIPPLDSAQVLDLQRSAGNRLTSHALARWTVADDVAGLLAQLLAARSVDPPRHAKLAAAVDGLEARLRVRLGRIAGAAEPVEVEIHGPAGGGSFGTATLEGPTIAQAELSLAAAFGAAATIAPGHGLAIRLRGPDGTTATALIPVPFEHGAKLALGAAGYVASVEAVRP
jgi:hypothetical protein